MARAMSTARQWGNQNFNCQVCKASLPVGTEGPLIIFDSTLMLGRRGDALPKVHMILEVESGQTISELESKIDNYKEMKVTIIFFFENQVWYYRSFRKPSVVSLMVPQKIYDTRLGSQKDFRSFWEPNVLLTCLLCRVPSIQYWLGG